MQLKRSTTNVLDKFANRFTAPGGICFYCVCAKGIKFV